MNPSQKVSAAIASTFAASILSSVCGASAKYSKLTGREINLCFGTMYILYSICYILFESRKRKKYSITKKSFGILTLNGFICTGCSSFFFYRAFDLLPYGDIYAVNYSTIFIASIIAEKVKLNKKPPFLTCLAAFISFVGLLLFSQPCNFVNSFASRQLETLDGVLSATVSGLASAVFFFNLQLMKSYPTEFHWFAYSLGLLSASLPSFIAQVGSISGCLVIARITLILSCALWPFQVQV